MNIQKEGEPALPALSTTARFGKLNELAPLASSSVPRKKKPGVTERIVRVGAAATLATAGVGLENPVQTVLNNLAQRTGITREAPFPSGIAHAQDPKDFSTFYLDQNGQPSTAPVPTPETAGVQAGGNEPAVSNPSEEAAPAVPAAVEIKPLIEGKNFKIENNATNGFAFTMSDEDIAFLDEAIKRYGRGKKLKIALFNSLAEMPHTQEEAYGNNYVQWGSITIPAYINENGGVGMLGIAAVEYRTFPDAKFLELNVATGPNAPKAFLPNLFKNFPGTGVDDTEESWQMRVNLTSGKINFGIGNLLQTQLPPYAWPGIIDENGFDQAVPLTGFMAGIYEPAPRVKLEYYLPQ